MGECRREGEPASPASHGCATLGGVSGPSAAAPKPAEAVFTHPTYSSPIALSADNRFLWSVNPSDDSVSIVRTDRDTVVRKLRVGKEPQSVALDPNNGFAYVANAAGSSVSVIRILDDTLPGFDARVVRTIRTGAEPWNVVISPDGKRVFVANSGQDTITVINALNRQVIGQIDLRKSKCNVPDPRRHFQPRGMAVTLDNRQLLVTRFLSFVKEGGKQGEDDGKEGVVCRLRINTAATEIGGYRPTGVIRLAARPTGFAIDSPGDGVPGDGDPEPTIAFPNQLQSIVIRGDRAYLPNIAASPESPLQFQNSTEAFVNVINGVGAGGSDGAALNLHLGARDPEPGKKKLFFANQWAIAFATQTGPGAAYIYRGRARSDLLVKLNVDAVGGLGFHRGRGYYPLHRPQRPGGAGDQRRERGQEPARHRHHRRRRLRLRRELRFRQHLEGRPPAGQGSGDDPHPAPATAGLLGRDDRGRGGVLTSPAAGISTGRRTPQSRPTSACRRRAGKTAPAATSRAGATAWSGSSAPGRASRSRWPAASTRATARAADPELLRTARRDPGLYAQRPHLSVAKLAARGKLGRGREPVSPWGDRARERAWRPVRVCALEPEQSLGPPQGEPAFARTGHGAFLE